MLYRAYRLTLRSTLPIPGALAAPPDAVADVVIGEGTVVAEGKRLGPYWLRDDGRLVFEMPGVARFLCDADSITVERIGDSGDDLIAAYLIATALPALLWMRGEIVLHAAAAMLPGASGAVAVIGPSGSGKSTVLRALVGMGARILADDTLCVWRTDAGVSGSGLAGGYFLGEPPRAFHSVEGGLDSAPLSGMMLLEPRVQGAPEIRAMPRLDALTTLIANRHRPRVPVLLGLQAGLMLPTAELAGAVPAYGWRRREGATALEPQEIAWLGGAV